MLNLTDRRKNVFTEATVAKTTEAAASVASNVATALITDQHQDQWPSRVLRVGLSQSPQCVYSL